MNDLTNSFFKFNNSFTFDEFNQDEKQNDNNEKKESDTEKEEKNVSDINEPSPKIDLSKERKILTNWLDAEYNSTFQYKKVNITPNYTNNIEINEEIDIDDPIIVYDYLKKYTNFLYDYDCPKDIEKIIIDCLEKELKEYYKVQATNGLDKHLNNKFIKLKNKYLLTTKNTTPTIIPQNKITYITTELINKLENCN